MSTSRSDGGGIASMLFCAAGNELFCSNQDEQPSLLYSMLNERPSGYCDDDGGKPAPALARSDSCGSHIVDIEPAPNGIDFRIVVPSGCLPGQTLRVQTPNGGRMMNVILPPGSEPGAKITVTPPRPVDLVTVSAQMFEDAPACPEAATRSHEKEVRTRFLENQLRVYRISTAVAGVFLVGALILVGCGIAYAVVGTQMRGAFVGLGTACNVTAVDYRGKTPENHEWSYKFRSAAVDGVARTYTSERVASRRSGSGGASSSKISVGDARRCWAPKKGRRSDLPRVPLDGFACGDKFCVKLAEPLKEAWRVLDHGVFLLVFGFVGGIISFMFDQVAVAAIRTAGKAHAGSKRADPRPVGLFDKLIHTGLGSSAAMRRGSWPKY